MKKVFLNVWKKALVLSLAAITFVITACGEDSGLGSTVDTEAPKIEITYPPLGANIRGTFVLAGSCDDDKSVKSIIVTVTDTTTKKVVGTIPASIENGGKSWKASVNNYSENDKKYDYLDGNYQFTAEIHDGAGHKNSASRTFDLDNTAPVFVASNPGVIKSQNKKASAYGSIFTIDGTIADDHTIASLTAKIFDENGNLIGNYKEEDIATAGGTSVTIASHYVDKGDGTAKTEQNDRYTQIYGDNDEAGTKQYYCTVLVEDSTKSYENPGESENTTSGNITSEIYLYDSVYKSLMSTKSGNRYGLSAADFMTLLNGTRAKDEKTETALKILKEVVVDTGLEAESDKDENKLSFSLNPMANPTYSVNGFAVSKDPAGNAAYKEAFSDSTVVVSVNAGLDKTAILPGNLKVWTVLVDGLSPEDAQKRVNLVANKVTALQKIHSTVDEVHERADEIIDGAIKYADKEFGVGSLALVKDNSDDSGASVQTETLSCVLPKDTYISGKVYAFVVTGYDEDDVAFLQNTLYAFKANEAGIAPTLIIKEPTNQSYIKTTEGLVFKGETYLPEGSTLKVSKLKINLHVQDENKQNVAVGKQDGYTVTLTYDEATGYSSTDDSLTYNPTSKEWTFTPSKMAGYAEISANEGEGKSYFYTLDITSESSSGNAASKTLSVHIDATMPKVTIANVTPCVSGAEFYSEAGESIRNYVNGDIAVKFNIEETNLKEVSYKVLVDGEEKVPSVSLGRVFSGSINDLDTTKWTSSAKEKKNLEVIITAVDTCGNTTSYSTTEYNTVTYKNDKNEEVNFNKPIIICQETDIPQIKFNNTAELSYTTEKDGKIIEHSFLVIEEPKGATEEQKAEVAKKNAENKKSIVATHNLFNIENNNTIQIALEDDDNIASAKVWVYDENGKLYKADGFKNPSTLQVNKTSHTWNYVLPSKEGIYQIYVEVTDTKLKDDLSETVKLWRKNSVGKFFVAVDAGAPTVEIKTPVANSYQKVAFAASGTVSEKANITLERAIYKTGTDPKFVDVTGKIGAEKDGKYPWAETDADIKGLSDGDYTLSYKATDRYEQSSTVSVNVKVDTKEPEFLDNESRVFVVSSALPGKAYVENTWYNNEAINIEGKFLEANGISNIYYWLDKDVGSLETATGSFTAVTEEEKDPADETKVIRVVSTYKTTIPGFTESKDGHNLTLVAVDLAGNESEKIEYPSIKVDMSAPKFDKYYYTMGSVEGEATGEILTNGNEDIILYGLISDAASGVKDLKLELVDKNGTRSDFVLPEAVLYTSVPTEEKVTDAATGEITVIHHDATTQSLAAWFKADTTTFEATPEDATNVTAWKATVSKSLLSAEGFEGGEIRATYSDNAGNIQKNLLMFRLNVDQIKPELSNQTLEDTTPKFNAVRADIVTGEGESKTTTFRYYVNNSNTHKFNLNGVATDNRGVASVGLKIGSAAPVTQTTTGDFKFTDLDLSSINSTNNKLTLIITDKAANITEVEIQIIPDVTAPKGEHDKDTKGKDLTFRVGDANNDLDEKINAVRTTITELTAQDKDVGGKYSEGTYGNSNAIKVRGYFEETGSGLESIYYKIFQGNPPTAADITNFVNDYENAKTGYFAPLSSDEEKLVKKNNSATDSTDYEYVKIASNYKFSIAGFAEGKNYLVLAAVDKVGNIKLDNVTYTYTPTGETTAVALNGCYSINVDTVVPTLSDNVKVEIDGSSEGLSASQILTNFEKGDITLSGSAFDKDSKVSSVTLYVEGKGKKKLGNVVSDVTIDKNTTDSLSPATISTPAVSASAPEGTTNWTGKVAASLFDNLGVESGTFAVYATVKDNAGDGNMVNRSVATIIVDKEAPTVVLKSPVDADSSTTDVEINGIIDLSGEINDGNILPDTAITAFQYTTTAPASATDSDWIDATASLMTGFALSGNYTFSAKNFNTSKLTDETVYYLRAKAIDKAGNVGYSPAVEVKVDQDTDRPIIKFTSMDEANAIISSENILGTISDDDGIEEFYYKDASVTDSAKAGYDWTPITVSSGSWQIDGLAASGHDLSFQIKDSAGTIFETAKTTFGTDETHFTTTGYPYVVYGKNVLNRLSDLNSAAVSFKVDLNDPSVAEKYFASSSSNKIAELDSTVTTATAWKSNGQTVSYGPQSKYMFIKVVVKEDVSMHSASTSAVTADLEKDIEVKIKDSITLTNIIKLESIGSVGADNMIPYTYIIGPINTNTNDFKTAAGEGEGNKTVTISVTDKSGRKSADTFNVFIDNTPPEVKIFYNDPTDGITGKVTIPGSVSDSTGIKEVKYLIPTVTQTSLTDAELKDIDNFDWKDIPGTAEFYREISLDFTSSSFTKADGTSLIYYATHKTDSTLTYALTRSGTGEDDDPYTYAQAASDATAVYVPIYFYTEDANGSKGITRTYRKVYPDGGIPKTELTSHAEKVNGSTVTLVKTGNKVNLMGTAEDDEGVASVKITKLEYVTIKADSITDSTTWTNIDISTLSSDSTEPGRAILRGTVDGSTIVCDGTTSWKATINTANLGFADLTAIRVTVEAFDENSTSSSRVRSDGTTNACIHRIVVDKNVPELKSVAVVGFADTPASVDATPVFEKSYEPGMYFSDKKASKWYLKATITDDSSVTGINISCMTGTGYISAITPIDIDYDGEGENATTDIAKLGAYSGFQSRECTVLIPITTTAEGHVYATLEMLDGQHTDVTTAFSFFIDNTPPALYKTSAGTAGVADTALAHAKTLRLKSNGMQIDTETNVVENSDGSYTFGDELVEARSGLAYVAFYFKKAASETFKTKNRVYSSMFGKDDGDNVVEVVDTKADGKVYINKENLPALVKTVTITNTTTDGVTTSTVTFTDLGKDKFINNKKWLPDGATDVSFGLVKIGGAYHKITKIEGDVATLGDEVSDTYTEAEFIYAMLVDHQIAEGFSSSASDTTGVSNDDGDGLVEMVKQTGSTYKWTASILSDNIPDGPAEIHIVAFDEAGNVNSGYVETSIQNNRPRIARVYLATDLNGNSLFDFDNGAVPELDSNSERYTENGTEYGELAYYSTLTKESKVQATATLKKNQCNFVVSNRLLVLPEIIGGNGTNAELRYAYSVSDNLPDALSPVDAEPESVGITKATGTALKSFSSDLADLQLADRGSTTDSPVTTNIETFLGSRTPTDANGYFVKNGTVPTNNRGYLGFVLNNTDLGIHESWVGDTKIKKYFAFTIWDKTSETTQGEDSLYAILKLPLVINVEDDVRPKADITPFYWHSKEDGSFVYDENGNPEGHIDLVAEADKNKTSARPGVSGTVYVEGTAYDETRLSKIEVKDPSGTAYTIAEYVGGTWKTAENATEAGTNGWTWPDNYISSKVETISEPSQKGHKVAWKLEVNMTKFGIKTDQSVYVTAYDASTISTGKNSSINSSVQTVCDAHTSRYRMDFVPYIKSIYPATESSAARSRLGKFPVQAGKDMYIEGMNFSTDLEYWIGFSTTPENEALISSPNTYEGKFIEDDDVTKVENGKIKVTAPQNSCYVRVWVKPADGDWTYTKNNMNENAGCDIEDGYVPSDDNGKGNRDRGLKRANDAGTNFWTDDRYIAVWNVDTEFAGSINPHSGLIKKIKKEDTIKQNGSIGIKEKGSLIEPTTDLTDYYVGFMSSDDMRTYIYEGTKQRMTMCPSADLSLFTAPVDAVDCIVLGGLPYYICETNYVGNVNANCWGPGLIISREGFAYDRSVYETTTTLSETSLPWIIERQGDQNSAMKRDSSTGYDSVLYQFKNPRIAGWHTDNPDEADKTSGGQALNTTTKKYGRLDYIYVCYYDSFAKCLKYAAYRSGTDVDNTNRISLVNNSDPNSQWGGGASSDYALVAEVRSAGGNMTNGATVVAGRDWNTKTSPTASDFVEKAGEWSDIVVDTTAAKPIPVIVYYNETNRRLEVARGKATFPKSSRLGSTITTGPLSGADAWIKSNITPNEKVDFGRYVSAAIDAAGNLHVAAQDATNAKLYYLYLTKSGDNYTISKSVIVDASSGAGRWTDIELTNPKGETIEECMPVISYINTNYLGTNKGIKTAYIESFDSEGTPKFEALTDPTLWQAGDQRTSVMADVKETKAGSVKAPVAVGFNSDMLALDFLRGEE